MTRAKCHETPPRPGLAPATKAADAQGWVITMTILFDGAMDSAQANADLSMSTVGAIVRSAGNRGIATRAEAEALFLMDRSGQLAGVDAARAVGAIRDHLVTQSEPSGHVMEHDVDWLLGMVGDRPTAFGRAFVFSVVRACETAPPRLAEMAMRAAVGRCLLV
jgi:hypothetical protein